LIYLAHGGESAYLERTGSYAYVDTCDDWALAVAMSVPTSAATKKKPVAMTVNNFEACEQKALDQGLVHGQAGHAV
jgi:hypothetical protein